MAISTSFRRPRPLPRPRLWRVFETRQDGVVAAVRIKRRRALLSVVIVVIAATDGHEGMPVLTSMTCLCRGCGARFAIATEAGVSLCFASCSLSVENLDCLRCWRAG